MSVSKYGVAYDIVNSPYSCEYREFVFYFSSLPHKHNFLSKVQMKEEWLSHSLSKRFHFSVDATMIAIFQLYAQVETRGFYVIAPEGRELKSLNDIQFMCNFA